MELPTPEQLKAEKAERDSVLAELLVSERANKDLKENNEVLGKELSKKTVALEKVNRELEEKKRLVADNTRLLTVNNGLKKVQSDLNKSILEIQKHPEMLSLNGQRDKLSHEIAALVTQKETLTKTNGELIVSNTDLDTRISGSTGRLAELEKQEKERLGLVSKEVSDLEGRKSTLSAEVPAMEKNIEGLKTEKEDLIEVIGALQGTHERLSVGVSSLESVIQNAIKVSGENITDFKSFFADLRKNVEEIIDINKKNATESQMIVSKLPRVILDMQRPREIIRPILNKRRLASKKEIE